MYDLARVHRKQLLEHNPKIKGFNMGFNLELAEGEMIFHAGVELEPVMV